MSIIQRVHSVLASGADQRASTTRTSERPSPNLYRCSSCDTTFISQELDTCPRCDQAVETVPTGRDLGYVR